MNNCNNLNNILPGIGIFGLSDVSSISVAIFKNLGFKVIGVWAHNSLELKHFAEKNEIAIFSTDQDQVLVNKDIQLICIMTQPYFHSQIATKALFIGKHVICIPPAGLNEIDAKKITKASQYYPTLISIMAYTLRYIPAYINLKKAMDNKEIGDILTCEYIIHRSFCSQLASNLCKTQDQSIIPTAHSDCWVGDKWMGGGLLNTLGSHAIDILSYLLSDEIIRVCNGEPRHLPNTSSRATYISHHKSKKLIRDEKDVFPVLNDSLCGDNFLSFHAYFGNKGVNHTRATVIINGDVHPLCEKEELVLGGEKGTIIYDGKSVKLYLKSVRLKEVSPKMPIILYNGELEAINEDKYNGLSPNLKTSNENVNEICLDESIKPISLKDIKYPHLPNGFFVGLENMIISIKEAFTSCKNGNWAKRSLSSALNIGDGHTLLYLRLVIEALRTSQTFISSSYLPHAAYHNCGKAKTDSSKSNNLKSEGNNGTVIQNSYNKPLTWTSIKSQNRSFSEIDDFEYDEENNGFSIEDGINSFEMGVPCGTRNFGDDFYNNDSFDYDLDGYNKKFDGNGDFEIMGHSVLQVNAIGGEELGVKKKNEGFYFI
ncbi:glucose-fructose oxidoreductase domain-containing protein 2-like [Gordionus sp. m RMFG-2023]|uniref:glucose-fructose oxidoreductase domain-containing protein 2-like n=1 Tax=Gordionus sp. m RMFG-2023 TaxID=3053472 RepID=UPI0031FD9ED7